MTGFTRASRPPSTDACGSARCRSAHQVIVLTFDAEGRAVDFDVWVDDLQLFLQCDSRDGVSLFDHTHLPPAERAHFGQYKTTQSLYDAVVARYSSPATAALSHLMLPYLFPDLAAFFTVADLVTHLRTSYARYRAALPTEFCAKNPPPMYITLYYLVTRLLDSLSSVRDHFLSLCPTELTVDLLEERLAAAEKSILAVGASHGDRRTPFFEGCSPVPLLPSIASTAAVDLVATDEVGAASAPSGRRRNSKGKGSKGGGGGGGGGGEGGGVAEGVAVEVGVVPGVGASVAVVEVVEAVAEVKEAAAAVVEVAAVVVLVEVRPRSMEALVVASATQWSLRRPVYGLRQAPCEWHDTLRTTLAALGFAPSTADPSLFLRSDTSLPPFYILVYVDDLVFATADTAGLAHVKSELQKRHTCTDLGELRSYLGLQITRDRAQRTITLTQSHMVQQVLQRFDLTYSSPQATPLSTRHSLSALPSDESVESSGPYPELVGCLMYLMTCTRPDLAYPLSILARYVAPGRHRPEHMAAAKRVLRYLCSTSGLGLVLGGRRPVVLTGHADASWADDQATQRSSQGYTFSLGSGSVSWRSTRSSSILGSSCEAEIYAGAMAAQELRWLTYLLTDLGEQPCSPQFSAWLAAPCLRGLSGQHC
ncbi:unnamed protein product [Closterium sp. NIES-54]